MVRNNKKWKRKRLTPKETIRNERKKETIFGILIISVLIVAASVGGWYLIQSRSSSQSEKQTGEGGSTVGVTVGSTALDFTLTDIVGNTFRLSDHKGNIVIIDFMATWCGPCFTQTNYLKQIYSSYASKGVLIISIDVDPTETSEMLTKYKSNSGAEWIFALGPDFGTKYQFLSIPTIVIVDRTCIIMFRESSKKIST